jgi:hypothetical protein
MNRKSAALLGGLIPAGRLPSSNEHIREEKQNELRSLRGSCGKQPAFNDAFRAFMTRLSNALVAYMFVNGGSSKRMCENYGHLTPSTFTGAFPRCQECGIIIKDPAEVRKASLRDQPK